VKVRARWRVSAAPPSLNGMANAAGALPVVNSEELQSSRSLDRAARRVEGVLACFHCVVG
jgi:hypothetical protein